MFSRMPDRNIAADKPLKTVEAKGASSVKGPLIFPIKGLLCKIKTEGLLILEDPESL